MSRQNPFSFSATDKVVSHCACRALWAGALSEVDWIVNHNSLLLVTCSRGFLCRPSERPLREPGAQGAQLLLKDSAVPSDALEEGHDAPKGAESLDVRGERPLL